MILETPTFSEAFALLAPSFIVLTLFFLIVLGGFLWMVQSYFDYERKSRLIDIRLKTQDKTLPLQLNAYERMILYLERLNPSSLLTRNYEPGMKARDLREKAIQDVRLEYEHNLTQQIYVSLDSWDILKKVKDETIMLLNLQSSIVNDEISGIDFTKLVFERMNGMEINPYDYAINAVKKEIHQLF